MLCPFGCPGDKTTCCEHLVGWTEDSQTITYPVQGRKGKEPEAIRPDDVIVKTGVAIRVYRKGED